MSLPRIRKYPLFLYVLLCLSACTGVNTQEPAQSITISGTLLDADSSAVPDAVVTAISSTGITLALDSTDVQGTFTLSGLPSTVEGLSLRVEHPAYSNTTASYESLIAKSSPSQFSILLSHHDSCCGTLSVSGVSGGAGVDGISVTIHKDGHRIAHRSTNHSEAASFHHLCEGEYIISVAKDGYHIGYDTVNITGCDSITSTVTLSHKDNPPHDSCCANTASITVIDSASQLPLHGSAIRLTKDGHLVTSVSADHSGAANLNHLCEGDYQLEVTSNGYVHKTVNLVIACEESAQITVQLASNHTIPDTCCSGLLLVRAFHAGHSTMNIDQATVTISSGHQTIASALTGSDGIASFDSLCNLTDYTITILKHGYHAKTISFRSEHCDVTTYDIELEPQ
jgi:hypothetical protein